MAMKIDDATFNDGEPATIFVRILRGPLTWQTKSNYQVFPGDHEITFSGEEFKKKSGFYFTKEGAELKRAIIQVIKVENA